MRFWIRLDDELRGALDESGCYHRPSDVLDMLDEYGIRDFEERRVARLLLRQIGRGRALALSESFEEREGA